MENPPIDGGGYHGPPGPVGYPHGPIQYENDPGMDPVLEVALFIANEAERERLEAIRSERRRLRIFYGIRALCIGHSVLLIIFSLTTLIGFAFDNVISTKCGIRDSIWIGVLLFHELNKITLNGHSIAKKRWTKLVIQKPFLRKIKIFFSVTSPIIGYSILIAWFAGVLCDPGNSSFAHIIPLICQLHFQYYLWISIFLVFHFSPEILNFINKKRKQRHIRKWVRPYSISMKFKEWIGIEDNCVICREEYQPNQTVRQLRCQHEFHRKCIDQWLEEKQICPICRQEVEISRPCKRESVQSTNE